MTLTTMRWQYSDIQVSTADPSVDTSLAPTYDVEITMRLKSYFSLGAMAGQSTNGEDQNFGLGFRCDTPGFFFIGGKPTKDAMYPMRRYPMNTSIFGYFVQQNRKDEATNLTNRYTGSNLGLAIDLFLFNPYTFLSVQASIFNMKGNAYFANSVGLGVQF